MTTATGGDALDEDPVCPLGLVRRTTASVVAESRHVKISREAIRALVASDDARLGEDRVRSLRLDKWDETDHLVTSDADLTAQYLLVVDAANFCFWPDGELEYEHLAGNLRRSVEADPACLDADRLAGVTGEGLRALLRWPRELPQEEERARLVREVGAALARHFGGKFSSMVRAADGSASALVDLITKHFPGFRDSCVYKGRQVRASPSAIPSIALRLTPPLSLSLRPPQVFLYKRAQVRGSTEAKRPPPPVSFTEPLTHSLTRSLTRSFDASSSSLQILVGDIYGAFKGKGLGAFGDIRLVTMFADYRVPVTLLEMGVLEYSEELRSMVQRRETLASGCEMEVEIRAATVQAVEMIIGEMAAVFEDKEVVPMSIEMDWYLWREGEKRREVSDPHHRVLTIFY